MLTGSCLCGATRYRLEVEPGHVMHCHCSMCRKLHGSPFATFGVVKRGELTWLEGESLLTEYESSPGAHRHFCSRCGSMMPGGLPGTDIVFITLGTLDDPIEARAQGHMFAPNRAPWIALDDDLPQFDAYPPGFDAEPVERPAPPAGTPGALPGGCLCGAVRFEIDGDPMMFANCHCNRCRHARAAPHAGNIFVAGEQLRWLSGEAQIVRFDLPGAERFGNDFCRTCGSKVPRPSPQGDRYNVPSGSIEGDPGLRPKAHIFVGSKANWFEITDAIPQHDEYA